MTTKLLFLSRLLVAVEQPGKGVFVALALERLLQHDALADVEGNLLDDIGIYTQYYKHVNGNMRTLKEMLSHTMDKIKRCQYNDFRRRRRGGR